MVRVRPGVLLSCPLGSRRPAASPGPAAPQARWEFTNVFETFRGGESALIFSCVSAIVRHIFGSDTFTVDPYQLGYANTEGLKSGAWWFYYKLGFRSYDACARRVLSAELAKIKTRLDLTPRSLRSAPGDRRSQILCSGPSPG